jgi:hypothetical protein
LARREIIEVTCDICGAVVDSAVVGPKSFGVDGQRYTIDLCVTHINEFDKAVAPFAAKARTATAGASRSPVRRRRSRSAGRSGDPKAIRAWARNNGFPSVSDRGRVPGEILRAWQAAQGGTAAANGTTSRRTKARTVKKAATKKNVGRRRAAAGRKATASASS